MSAKDLKTTGLILLLGFTPVFLVLSIVNSELIPLFIISLVSGLALFLIGREKEKRNSEEYSVGQTAAPYTRSRRKDSGRRGTFPPYLYQGNVLNERYLIRKRLKKGGMSIITLAQDIETDMFCVIKAPRRDTGHDASINVEKLSLEATVLSQLNHPNIVRYLDMFLYDDMPHLVVEHIEGENLFDLLSKKPAAERRVIRWGDQILSALDHMHRFGLIHRDVNPGNIMLTRDDNVIIIDFGTTKPVDSEGVTVIKTPGFEVPEMVSTGYADERSDLFGVGGTLFYLLTSTPPGLIGNRNAAQILLSKGVSERTAWCIAQALQMDADLRFQSAAAMRQALCGNGL